MPGPMVTKPFGGLSDEGAKKMLHDDMTVALGEVLEIITAAKEAGYFITYATGEIDGQQQITRLDVVKAL